MAESLESAKVHVQHQRHGGHDCESLGVHRYTKITNDTDERRGGQCKHYVSLHHHSTYSYLDGFALPEAHVRRCTEIGMGSLALTEHGNISSHVQLEKAAVAQGVKPIFGCEVYMAETLDTQRKNHLTVLAADREGYKNLLRLVSRGWDQFYYEPTVTHADLEEFHNGLVVLSGCTGSLLATSLLGGKNIAPEDASYKRAKAEALRFKNIFGDRYYLECQAFPELENVRALNTAYAQMGTELGIPLVATGDVHYTRPLESELQKILHNVRGGGRKTMEQLSREWGYDVKLCPPTSDKYMLRRMEATGLTRAQAVRSILATEEIAARCTVTIPKMPEVRFPIPSSFSGKEEYWHHVLRIGWNYRGIARRPNTGEYVRRLKQELSVIEEKDFVDYFLFVSDMVIFAKERGIAVGPGRGSAAASLVCYLLRITEVDPILYPDLLFERFIDVTRKDLPDIDIDFDDERRSEVRDYLVAKYGEAQVGNIGTFTTYKSKLALDDVARVRHVPKYQVETIKALLVERSSGDLRASATIEDTMMMFPQAADVFKQFPELGAAMDLEGNVKGMGVHAAGLVVAGGPLTDVCAVYSRVVDGQPYSVLSVDKYDAEYLNILKMDNLGLTTMGMIGRCLKMIDKPLSFLYEIPLDDPKTLQGFQDNDVVGIFQFDGRAMRNVNGELKPDDFLEVCAVTALARPGPLHNGATAEYIDIKRGTKAIRAYHPAIASIVGKTHGQIVYQEQILRICGEVGGFDHTHRATIRKIISRKIGEQEFMRWWERFRDGAVERGVDEHAANAIWRSCITAGSYAFNVAHSLGYGMIAWWTMYLKQHHPVAFYTASLQKYGKDKQLDLMKDAEAHGIKILPPHPRLSQVDWTRANKGIRAGFSQVHGIGDTVGEKIAAHRDEHGLASWGSLAEIKGIGPAKVKAFEEFTTVEDPFGIHRLERMIAEVVRDIKRGQLGSLPWPTHTALEVPYSRTDTNVAVTWIGELHKRNLRELFELHFSRTGEELDATTVKDPQLNEWVVMDGYDGTEVLTMTVSRWNYPRLRNVVWRARLGNDLVLVQGFKRGNQARRAIYLTDMWVISTHQEEEE